MGDMKNFEEVYEWYWSKSDNVYIENGYVVADSKAKIIKYNPINDFKLIYTYNEESIFTKFASINIENSDEILNFIKQFGFLYNSIYDIFQNKDRENEPYMEDIKEIIENIEKFKQLVKLDLAMSKNVKDYELCIILKKLNKKYLNIPQNIVLDMALEEIKNFENQKNININNSLRYYCLQIIEFEYLKKEKNVYFRPIIDKNDMEIKESWYAKDLISVIYHLFYLKLTQKEVLKKCQNIKCTNYFPVYINDTRKKYCTPECANVQGSRDYRNKYREKINKQKRDKYLENKKKKNAVTPVT